MVGSGPVREATTAHPPIEIPLQHMLLQWVTSFSEGLAVSQVDILLRDTRLFRVGVHWPLLDGVTDRGRLATLRP